MRAKIASYVKRPWALTWDIIWYRHSVKNIVVSPSQEEMAKQETTKREADTESVESDGKHN